MEEILASIRRIISEDEKPEEEGADSRPSDDVLELTEVAEEEEAEPETVDEDPESEESAEEAEMTLRENAEEGLSIDDVLNETETGEELELRDEAEARASASEAAPSILDAGLIAAQTEAAAGNSLSALVSAVDRAHGGSSLGDGTRTIEDLVKEVMRPMVKEWLDENLPRLTERLVRREIERLARHAERD